MATARDDLINAQQYEWDIPCEFQITRLDNSYLRSKFADIYNKQPWLGHGDSMDMFVEDIRLDGLTSHELIEYYAGQWSFAVGRLDRRKFTITFRDYNKSTIYSLLEYFQKALQHQYPEDQHWQVYIKKTSYMNRKSEGLFTDTYNNAKQNINNLINGSGIKSVTKLVDTYFDTGLTNMLDMGLESTGLNLDGNYLIRTHKAVLVAVSSEIIGQGLENQFTRISADFIYTDTLDLAAGVKPLARGLGLLDQVGGLVSKVTSIFG